MRCAMKNAVELVPVIGSMYDFAINEECHEWDECGVSEVHAFSNQ